MDSMDKKSIDFRHDQIVEASRRLSGANRRLFFWLRVRNLAAEFYIWADAHTSDAHRASMGELCDWKLVNDTFIGAV